MKKIISITIGFLLVGLSLFLAYKFKYNHFYSSCLETNAGGGISRFPYYT